MSFTFDILLVTTGWTHILLAPYTKVEESFNLHAVHDVLMYGVRPSSLRHYDHFVFPGAVPRTFVGSLALAGISSPLLHLASRVGYISSKLDLQILIRLVLASLNAIALCMIRRSVSRRFGRPTSFLFVLLTISQFHLPFWMGRTLPNMFALLPVTLSWHLLIDQAPNATRSTTKNVTAIISLLTFATVVFRAELLFLLGPLTLQLLVLQHATPTTIIKTVLIAGSLSLALTVIIDSWFWDKWPLWPEFSSVYFNVYEGKSSEWGTSPWHTYLTSHLPKLLLSSLPLSLLGALIDPRIRTLLVPPITFIVLISFLGHKEWRFIVYVVPIFNVVAARGARWMASRRKGSLWGRLLFVVLVYLLFANALATYLLTLASIWNYPGGQALSRFNELYEGEKHVHVHISNLAAQTGASLFLHENSPPYVHLLPVRTQRSWIYDKTEHLTPLALSTNKSVTHLVSEAPLGGSWRVMEGVPAFRRWSVDLRAVDWTDPKRGGGLNALARVVRVDKEDVLWILERRD